jgi:CheY-like chemotaxis protein
MQQRTDQGACTVLLVDDDPLISMSTAEMLMDFGHQVVEASSGSMALAILRAGITVDVVMTDQAMPGMTGIELAAEIHAFWPSLAIILATGYAELPKDNGPELPRIDKPYSQQDLANAIGKVTAAKMPS